MKKESTNKKNYFKLFFCILILSLIIFTIIKVFGKDKLSKQILEEENNIEINEIIENNTEVNENSIKNNIEVNTNSVKNNNSTVEKQNTVKKAENKVATSDTKQSKDLPTTTTTNSKGSTNSLPVLMYHYFYSAKAGETGKDANWMEISKFEEQLKYLKNNNYYFPTWKEVEDFVNGKIKLPKKSVVITMDDGNKSIYNYAIPMLDKYKIPATAFIITKNFDTKKIEKYKNSTIDFESHTNNMHRAGGTIGHGGIFPALSVEEGVKDLKESITKLNGNKNVLAYPYGDHTETTKKAVKQAGFKLAFTTENKKVRPGMDQYALPRVRMYKDITIKGFANSL